jgi:hypothetical protein
MYTGHQKADCGFPKYSDNSIYINLNCFFKGVPEKIWNFHIGGYQVCEKWLKDRGPKKGQPGRVLNKEDTDHYQWIDRVTRCVKFTHLIQRISF